MACARIAQCSERFTSEKGDTVKRVFGLILVGLGFALIVLAPLFRFYVGPSVAQTPLDTYVETTGSGVIIKQLDVTKFAAEDPDPYFPANVPVTSHRYTKSDLVAAEQDPAKSDNLAVFDTFSRTNTEDGRLVSAGESRYAFGRQNSVLANCCGAKVGDNTNVNFTGIVNLKFPFFVQQQTYNVWDDQILTSVPTQFLGEETAGGLPVYKFQYHVDPTLMPGNEQTVSKKMVGMPGSGDIVVNAYYTNTLTYLIEPWTGQVVATGIDATVTFRGPDGKKDLATFLDQEFPIPANITADSVASIASKANLLKAVMTTVPLVSLILGIVLAVVGFLLLRNPRKNDGDDLGQQSTSGAPPTVNV